MSAARKVRSAVCEKHGPYESLNISGGGEIIRFGWGSYRHD